MTKFIRTLAAAVAAAALTVALAAPAGASGNCPKGSSIDTSQATGGMAPCVDNETGDIVKWVRL